MKGSARESNSKRHSIRQTALCNSEGIIERVTSRELAPACYSTSRDSQRHALLCVARQRHSASPLDGMSHSWDVSSPHAKFSWAIAARRVQVQTSVAHIFERSAVVEAAPALSQPSAAAAAIPHLSQLSKASASQGHPLLERDVSTAKPTSLSPYWLLHLKALLSLSDRGGLPRLPPPRLLPLKGGRSLLKHGMKVHASRCG